MSAGQSYIVRLLRKVEAGLGEADHPSEASRVGKIIQKLAQAPDISDALANLYRVEHLDEFALRLMWLMDAAERGEIGLENGAMDYQSKVLGNLVIEAFNTNGVSRGNAEPAPAGIDDLYVSLHKFGRLIEAMKRDSVDAGVFRGLHEGQLYAILNELAPLKESALAAGKDEAVQFGNACSEFIHYVLDNGRLNDVRIVNVLDNANITLQTVFEVAIADDNDSLQSTIQLLKRPQDLLD